MKLWRICRLGIFLLTVCILAGAFSAQAQETPVLEGTTWEVSVLSIVGFTTSTATFVFSNGMLSINDWLFTLDPGIYQENAHGNVISFNATLEKPGIVQKQIFEVQGAAMLEEKIAGLLHNATTNMYYIFWGDPLPPIQ